jgi:phosphoadenosine phosphosulfate reductase
MVYNLANEKMDFPVFSFKDSEETHPTEVLKWGINRYHPKIAIASSFSVEDIVLIDMATQIEPAIKVFYINTGFHFKETEAIKKLIKKRYHLNLVEYSSLLSIEDQNLKYGPELHKENPDLCCKLRKVEPIKRALRELDAWITGLRREQAVTRKDTKTAELGYTDEGNPLIKVNPLAHWTRQQVWEYLENNKIPYNPLLDKGYLSIGCEPCTRPIQQGEDERAGRWVGKEKTECGIHTFMKKD